MPLKFYKGRASGTGAACDFYFNSKDECLFITIKKQSGFDEKKKLASFYNGEFCRMKFSTTEIGKFLRTLEKNKEASGFHGGYEGNKQQYFFKPYFDKENETMQKGFSLSFIKHQGSDKISFNIGFDLDEARTIKEYLIFVLNHIFSAIYAADKKASLERIKKKEVESKTEESQEEVQNTIVQNTIVQNEQPPQEPVAQDTEEDLF